MPLWKNITCWTAKEREPRRQAHDGEKERGTREIGGKEKMDLCERETSVERDNLNEGRRGRTKRDEEDERVKQGER